MLTLFYSYVPAALPLISRQRRWRLFLLLNTLFPVAPVAVGAVKKKGLARLKGFYGVWGRILNPGRGQTMVALEPYMVTASVRKTTFDE